MKIFWVIMMCLPIVGAIWEMVHSPIKDDISPIWVTGFVMGAAGFVITSRYQIATSRTSSSSRKHANLFIEWNGRKVHEQAAITIYAR